MSVIPAPAESIAYVAIPGYPGYRIGNDASVWSCWRLVGLGGRQGTRSELGGDWRRLKPCRDNNGYLTVSLRRDGKRRTNKIHALMCLCFIGPRPTGMHVCHNDGCPTNNVVQNLRYGTPKENHADSIRHGTQPRGERNGSAKLADDDVREIRRIYAEGGTSQQNLAERFGVDRGLISGIVRRKRWQHID
jgi:hypothetical protein